MAIELQQSCIDACLASARACEQCQHACLKEADLNKYAKTLCIARDCADVCIRSPASWRGKAITGGKPA